ncbi:hypothetical protein BG011_007025, partial [Mortierella polycephala]
MWKTVAKEERRIKDLLEDARRRAQRRRAFYDSKLGDPIQLLRVSGVALQLVTNPENHAHNEDAKNLMPWASDPSVRIDRFDGRALLDYLPSTTLAMIESGVQPERDEDGVGNQLRFERWHDLADKARLCVSEEQCLAENEEEWNDLVARHHALIGKVSEKKHDGTEPSKSDMGFGYNYGTEIVQPEHPIDQFTGHGMTALEEENIFEHLDALSLRERDVLDALGAEYYIKDYYQLLRVARQEQDARVNQLKVTAVNLERTLAGKKPLKAAEIEKLLHTSERDDYIVRHRRTMRGRQRSRSRSPAFRTTRRSSPSYEPYTDSSSRSGSASPQKDSLEFILEFQGEPRTQGNNLQEEDGPLFDDTYSRSNPVSKPSTHTISDTNDTPSRSQITGTTGNALRRGGIANPTRMSLAEKLKQRMRQGLDQSTRSTEIKRQNKEREQELAQARERGEVSKIVPSTNAATDYQETGINHSGTSDAKKESRSGNRNRGRSRSRDQRRGRSRSPSHSRRIHESVTKASKFSSAEQIPQSSQETAQRQAG